MKFGMEHNTGSVWHAPKFNILSNW